MNPEESTKLCDIKYKIVFLGEMYTGKTSIIQRFAKNHFNNNIQQTIGIDLTSKNICYKQTCYKLQLWDTAGQQKYRSLVPNYIRDAHCTVFVYDITNEQTFNKIDEWFEVYKNYQPEGSIAILVGNKCDKKQDRKISVQKGYELARKHDMAFSQVSAKTGQGIEDIFHSIVQNIDISNSMKCQKQAQNSTKASSIRKADEQKCEQKTKSQISHSGRLNRKLVLNLKQKKKQFACCYI